MKFKEGSPMHVMHSVSLSCFASTLHAHHAVYSGEPHPEGAKTFKWTRYVEHRGAADRQINKGRLGEQMMEIDTTGRSAEPKGRQEEG